MSDSGTTPTATAAIRHARVLETTLDGANVAISQHNAAILMRGQEGKSWGAVEWNKIAVYFKLAVRDDAAKKIKDYGMRGKDQEVDHIFEVRYFAAVFLYTIAEVILEALKNGKDFYPEIADISFAVLIVNLSENLESIPKEFHQSKTLYFTPGHNAPPKYPADLLKYLDLATSKFRAAVQRVVESVEEKERHRDFKLKLLQNLLSTPWCTDGQWKQILKERFSQNATLKDYVPNDFIDNNMFFDPEHKSNS